MIFDSIIANYYGQYYYYHSIQSVGQWEPPGDTCSLVCGPPGPFCSLLPSSSPFPADNNSKGFMGSWVHGYTMKINTPLYGVRSTLYCLLLSEPRLIV